MRVVGIRPGGPSSSVFKRLQPPLDVETVVGEDRLAPVEAVPQIRYADLHIPEPFFDPVESSFDAVESSFDGIKAPVLGIELLLVIRARTRGAVGVEEAI